MPSSKEFTISLDQRKVDELARVLKQHNAESLLTTLLDSAYEVYVERQDEVMPKSVHERILSRKLETYRRKIALLDERLQVKKSNDKKKVHCPQCDSRLKYDGREGEYACPSCDWRGEETEAILEE